MNPNSLQGQIAVVTGATGGMGQVIAVELARRGAHVVTVARNPQRADALRRRMTQAVGVDRLEVIGGDLSRRSDVLAAARFIARRHPAVHLLINNAGAHFPEHRLSADGIEMHIALDYLAAFGLTTLLSGALLRGRARVVNVASDTLNDTRPIKLPGRPRPATLDLTGITDLRQFNPRNGFVPFQAYATAKLMTVTAGYDLAHRLAPHGVTVNSLHPGIVATDIIDDLMPRVLRPFGALIRRTMLTPEQGAATAIRLATDPALADITGRYYIRDREASTPAVSHDPATQTTLRRLSDTYLASNAQL
jgi:NAD(P)-dependent dehydrogenase (short-subunit alcohol dehydrogenase family)